MDAADQLPAVPDELDVLCELVAFNRLDIVELGCGNARAVRTLLQRHPDCRATCLEVDAIQHAKNLAQPQERLTFLAAAAQSIPLPDASFDLALMQKSLHHVPGAAMLTALAEVARVLRPGGLFYVAEPIYDGALNAITVLYNDEGVVRAAAQAALDAALADGGRWEAVTERRYAVPVRFANFADFEQRMMRPTFADHRLDDAKIARVAAAFAPHCGPDGASFVRPMHVRLLRRSAA